jgi:primosomal protein N'
MCTLEYRHKEKEKAKNFIASLQNKLNQENHENNFDIILVPNPNKKHNQYYYRIIIKGNNIRSFLQSIKKEIF